MIKEMEACSQYLTFNLFSSLIQDGNPELRMTYAARIDINSNGNAG